jgi:hypothetical protein
VKGQGGSKKRRSYRPTVEALEALRLLSDTAQLLPGLLPAGDVLSGPVPLAPSSSTPGSAWDEALSQTELADLFGPVPVPATPTEAVPVAPSDVQDVSAGLSQLNRYLGRSWSRAGIPPQLHDDASQAVYVTLLQNLGRTRFDGLLADIGRLGIRDVLSRETADGPDFFRAIDTVKKRVQRERTFQPLDAIDVASASPGEDALSLWRGALQEAIDQSLTPREASLVYETLMGRTPAEIALKWGLAPKTVSNEKARVIQKLREVLFDDLTD